MTVAFGELLTGDGTRYGTWIKLPVADSVELVAAAGFDFVALDMEHAPLGVGTVHQLIGVARGCGIPALVRVPDRGASTIGRVLDSGAAGVLVPHVDGGTDARAVVAHARFPPHGTRGYGPTVRAGGWGSDPDGYLAGGEHVAVVPQLESPEAVAAVEDIARVPGLGALFVGPADLAVATGLPADSAEFGELLARVGKAAEAHRVPLGTAVGSATAARALPLNYDFVLVGNDATMLGRSAHEIVHDLRAAGDPSPPRTGPAKDQP
ncbi:HpcH/HpaI aldolase family protein [Pseudonocardia parietis]|uniref:2-keto-3-deoxy-L-rhamnonate aldolase RhmA n=1 Tax=Pseudonocardia parietis TaxID=570936 RepID=A0ABS4VSS2_9PSEU|nr:aldolase/citrate lyase family protein [Pseudonocardia parietis]MBP2366975.1 2-keto-3-deoxy-L-rhamnonate aldolase RhmA [Pseudonocardia parietis]